MSSISSSTSTVISFRGDDDVDLDEALRVLYQELQENLNHSQCSIRTLSLCSEQDNDFLEAANIYLELDSFVDKILELFQELKMVSKQCLGKPPNQEVKLEFTKMLNDRKEAKKKAKEAEKEAKEAEKKMKVKMMDIIQE
jgi:hypothetical protein